VVGSENGRVSNRKNEVMLIPGPRGSFVVLLLPRDSALCNTVPSTSTYHDASFATKKSFFSPKPRGLDYTRVAHFFHIYSKVHTVIAGC
jgi:hypothetical protein